MSEESWTVGEDLPLIEDGVYLATCTKVEEKHSDLYDKDDLAFTFRIDEPPYDGQEVWRYVSKPDGTIRPKMGLYKIAEALLGVKLGDWNKPLSRADFINRQCQIVVTQRVGQDGVARNKVTEVLRVRVDTMPPLMGPATKTPAEMVETMFTEAVEAIGEEETFGLLSAANAESGMAYTTDNKLVFRAQNVPLPALMALKRVLEARLATADEAQYGPKPGPVSLATELHVLDATPEELAATQDTIEAETGSARTRVSAPVASRPVAEPFRHCANCDAEYMNANPGDPLCSDCREKVDAERELVTASELLGLQQASDRRVDESAAEQTQASTATQRYEVDEPGSEPAHERDPYPPFWRDVEAMGADEAFVLRTAQMRNVAQLKDSLRSASVLSKRKGGKAPREVADLLGDLLLRVSLAWALDANGRTQEERDGDPGPNAPVEALA